MRRPIAVVSIVAGLLAITPRAQAKFNIRLVVDGPGLADPIELFNPSIDIGCVFSRPCQLKVDSPVPPVGARYEVVEWLEGHHARGRMSDRIVHDLYPYAPGGPRVFTPPGQTWVDWNRSQQVRGGWTRAPDELIDALKSAGLPEEPAQDAAARTVSRKRRTPAAAELNTAWAWMLPVSLALLIAGGVLFPRPRGRARRRRD
jgi:hypothetical protein